LYYDNWERQLGAQAEISDLKIRALLYSID
jgi:hypothetical protein